MKRLKLILPLLAVFVGRMMCVAQSSEDMALILRFIGADAPEDADMYEVERLADMLSSPVRLNVASVSALRASGLLTDYQTASLSDYRDRHGDVLSYMELAAVDGFGENFVAGLAPFVSLESSRLPGERSSGKSTVNHDIAVRGAVKKTGGGEGGEPVGNYGLKYRVEVGGRVTGAVAASAGYGDKVPSAWSGSLAWHLRKADIYVGDFNARFGQGLTLWNGMSMSGAASPEALQRRASGLSQSWSFSGSQAITGAAAGVSLGQFVMSAVVAVPGLKTLHANPGKLAVLPAANLSWYGRNGQVGVTGYVRFAGLDGRGAYIPDLKVSVDQRWCVRGVDVFSEIAFDWVNRVPAGLAGLAFPVGEGLRLAALVRYYPPNFSDELCGAARSGSGCSNEHGASVCGEFRTWQSVRLAGKEGFGSSVPRHIVTFSVDAACFPEPKAKYVDNCRQLKMLLNWQWQLSGSVRLGVRVTERMRNWGEPFRTDVRTDVLWQSARFSVSSRLNVLNCKGVGILGYVEGGYRDDKAAVYLRQGIFRIDDWDDRIYVYERDAPGSFNVPACYGRGIWTAMTAVWRFAQWGRMYARASWMAYPLMVPEKKKPGKAELKLQFVFRI